MATSAQGRLDSVSRQLDSGKSSDAASVGLESRPPSASAADDAALPPVQLVAPALTEPRAKDKVVIVTGTNSPLGIGRAAAYAFAHASARAVYLCDAVDDCLAAQQRDLQARCPAVDVHVRCFDAADESAVQAVVGDALRRYGRLDVFFANAGVAGPQLAFDSIDAADFMQTMRVNALGPFLAAKHAAPAMRQTSVAKPAAGGSIVMTASVAALRSNAGATPYSASKAAVVSLAQTLAYQLAGSGIRVNAVCPGLVETNMTAPTFAAARARGSLARIGQLNPTRRAAHSDEVARVVLFLASDEASYVNGQAWAVDGGLSAGHPFVPGKLS